MNRKISRRVVRVRNEMRLWLRTNFGRRFSYSKREIDKGRQELGFNSADDAFVAYSLFGADLSPAKMGSLELNALVEDLNESIEGAAFEPDLASDYFSDY